MTANAVKRARTKPQLRLHDYLPYRLSVAANEVSRLVSQAYEAQFGITTAQWRLMAHLGEYGELTPQRIGTLGVMDKVTVSRAAQGLIARGLVARKANGKDGRSHILALTQAGEGLYRTISPLALDLEQALLKDWSEAEAERLHDQLKKLQATAAALAGAARS